MPEASRKLGCDSTPARKSASIGPHRVSRCLTANRRPIRVNCHASRYNRWVFDLQETIVALASPPGGAARAIVRVSGPEALRCAGECFRPDDGTTIDCRRPTALAGKFTVQGLRAELPGVLYVWPTTRSYTRQPTVEFHTIGSPPLAEAVIAEFCRRGARLARPGEFTLRAFLAGRLDLTQAEAVLGVIDARGAQELQTALDQLAGGLALPLARLRASLIDLLAQLEAGLDFVEEDIEFIARDQLDHQLAQAAGEVKQLLSRMQARGETGAVVRVVLVGPPNVGKSSLFNALTGAAALVSAEAGTTRDYLSARLDLDGVVCELIDTAGMAEEALNGIEGAAQDATLRQRSQAHIELLCLDASRPLTDQEQSLLSGSPLGERIVVFTKCDQPRQAAAVPGAMETSSRNGDGLERLCTRLRELAAADASTGVVAATAVRCRESLRQALSALCEARRLARAGGEELVAAELRAALHHLGEVAGGVYTDDILDRIFSRFCIGK